MIEMTTGDEPDGPETLGDDALEAAPSPRPSPVRRLFSLVSSSPAMGIAALLIALATLGTVQNGTELGDAAYYGNSPATRNSLTVYQVSAGFRLSLAVVALIMALFAAAKVFLPIDDGYAGDEGLSIEELSIEDPMWIQAVVGAAMLVALVAIVASAVTFIYALQAHVATPASSFNY